MKRHPAIFQPGYLKVIFENIPNDDLAEIVRVAQMTLKERIVQEKAQDLLTRITSALESGCVMSSTALKAVNTFLKVHHKTFNVDRLHDLAQSREFHQYGRNAKLTHLSYLVISDNPAGFKHLLVSLAKMSDVKQSHVQVYTCSLEKHWGSLWKAQKFTYKHQFRDDEFQFELFPLKA